MLGQPKVVDSPLGKAVEFDGVDDALFIEQPPACGRQDVHMGGNLPAGRRRDRAAVVSPGRADPATGADTDDRMLFEIRVTGKSWSSTATSSPEP